ncbi:MAG: glycoside hydrolase family 95 protein [bacterium]|nr:glycoside hydrolase family 95 protein [bacterium]
MRALFLVLFTLLSVAAAQPPRWLWYKQPAAEWQQALPIGNGRLGGMVFGGAPRERIQLNEDSLWAGSAVDRDRKGAREHLAKARELLFAGKYAEAEKLVQREFMSERWVRSHQTLGDLRLEFRGHDAPQEYLRTLNLRDGIASTTYRIGESTYRREVYSSAAEQVLIVDVKCDGNEPFLVEVGLTRSACAETELVDERTLRLSGQANRGKEHPGTTFVSFLRVLAGDVARSGPGQDGVPRLVVRAKGRMTLALTAATSFGSGIGLAEKLAPEAALDNAKLELDAITGRDPDAIRQLHVTDHRALFDRVDIDLGGKVLRGLPTDLRLDRVRQNSNDPDLAATYFQFGRYLLMASSRPLSMPANLQGLWNEHIDAPWNADYHININLQMNYWLAEVGNLSECHEPFFDFVEALVPNGRKTAAELYGCKGWVAHHTSDAWAFTSPIGSTKWGMWPTGGAWCTSHFVEHYRFTGDKEFLKDRAWPILCSSAEFFLDYLVEHPATGKLVSGPSMSPENSFRTKDGVVAHVTMGPAMDQQIIADLFVNIVELAPELGIGKDDEFIKRVNDALTRLQGPQVGSDGRLLEWNEEFEEPEPGHRHMSHLYLLHPGDRVDTVKTPDLTQAVRKSLLTRLEKGGGHTGWSRAWIINFFARLRDPTRAWENHQALLRKSTLPNLFDDHPPFQIDGNFGAAAGIAEMLLQSFARRLTVLPALPRGWGTGHVKGLCARGGFVVDIEWERMRPTEIRVTSRLGNPLTVEHRGTLLCEDRPTKVGETVVLKP